ncbi:MAG: hypothetical protein RL223_1331 [Pseudomonadota bacterium]
MPPPTAAPAPRHDPATADPALQQAIAAFHAGELAAAQAALAPHLARHVDSWTGLSLAAVLAARTHREAEAEAIWLGLLRRAPDWVEGQVNLGLLYRGLQRPAQAEACLRQALRRAPEHAGAWHNLGLALADLQRFDEALQAHDTAARLQAGDPQPVFARGVLWQKRLDFDRAVDAYRQALARDPGHPGAHNNLVFCLQYLPRTDADTRLKEARGAGQALAAATARAMAAEAPGRAAAPAVARPAGTTTTATTAPAPAPAISPDGPLRIGFVSGDLRAHPVGFFLLSLFEHLAAPDLPLYAYANHGGPPDAVTQRLRARCAGWQTVDTWSDAALARRIAEDRIDILIDLAGHSALNRLGVFARRAAPLQIGWLGWFATTGLPQMDAVLADAQCVPPGEERWFSERVVRLAGSRLCFSAPDDAPPPSPLPCLTRPHFTFGSYQELAKINDEVLALWARVLQAVPHARLRLQSARLAQADVREAFIARALRAGLPAARLELHGPMDRAAYLASHAEVDVLLDTFPYPGGTTTCEALWMGVPTLTLATPGMLGRQGEGLMKAAQLPRWVARDADDYVAKAVRCASPRPGVRAGLAELRAGLRDHLPGTALFDGARHADDWARTLRALWQTHQVAHQATHQAARQAGGPAINPADAAARSAAASARCAPTATS